MPRVIKQSTLPYSHSDVMTPSSLSSPCLIVLLTYSSPAAHVLLTCCSRVASAPRARVCALPPHIQALFALLTPFCPFAPSLLTCLVFLLLSWLHSQALFPCRFSSNYSRTHVSRTSLVGSRACSPPPCLRLYSRTTHELLTNSLVTNSLVAALRRAYHESLSQVLSLSASKDPKP